MVSLFIVCFVFPFFWLIPLRAFPSSPSFLHWAWALLIFLFSRCNTWWKIILHIPSPDLVFNTHNPHSEARLDKRNTRRTVCHPVAYQMLGVVRLSSQKHDFSRLYFLIAYHVTTGVRSNKKGTHMYAWTKFSFLRIHCFVLFSIFVFSYRCGIIQTKDKQPIHNFLGLYLTKNVKKRPKIKKELT